MADVITRFKLETTQYDSKLRDASKGLAEYTRRATQAGNEFGKFTQANVEAARALGTITPSANNAKDKVKELVTAFNDAAKAYNALTKEQQQSDFGKAMAQSIGQLSQKIREAKSEMYDLDKTIKDVHSGGLFSGLGDKMSGALQVFGGNVMTKIAGMGVGLANEMADAVKQGIELARQGEGIRIAFERLGRGDILDGLRKATHGTVTDLELMKAAVKFNDFKLPLDELGVMLAYAQQKAKDTGQSVDYMVESITNGLGRKSLMILDNLGLSASEIKEKMAETGDMTKAVGAIIREQMAKAGDYVETAADRATQANVSLQNKMEELGRKFGPLEQASSNLWTSIKIGIMDIVGGPLTDFLNKLTEAGRLAQKYSVLGGSGKVGRMINNLSGAREGNRQSIYQQQQEQFWRYINPREQQIRDIRAWQRGERGEALQKRVSAITEKYGSLDATKIQAEVDAARKMLAEYIQGAKAILEGNPAPSPTSTTTNTPTGSTTTNGGASGNTFDASKIVFTGSEGLKIDPNAIKADPNANFQSVWAMMGGDEGLRQMLGIGKQQFDLGRDITEKDYKKLPGYKEDKETRKLTDEISTLTSGLSSIAGGLKSMGIKLPTEVEQVIGVIQGVTSVIEGINAVISVFSASTMSANTAALIANTTALYAEAATNFFPFARGGVVHAAGGYQVPGNRMSGDQVPAMLNSGELVLNKFQQQVLAANLQSGGLQGLHLEASVHAEQIRLALNNNGKRTGRGELVTWKR